MLGLFIYAAWYLYKECYITASFFFISALFFKQMALYYAPAIFFIILGSCLGPRTQWKLNIILLVKVGVTVLLTNTNP
ncbi:hypothetical protein FF38_11049 [Lucilia cuprina]|uniref:Alpha-1,3-glucosyltransferase n=1 Tax=Lucilia cuprina TaxID=7375 RepID=A0A0L0BQI6_LUCCU|nr:hypothetical protein FF38_11049 [Lucilia cuprina]